MATAWLHVSHYNRGVLLRRKPPLLLAFLMLVFATPACGETEPPLPVPVSPSASPSALPPVPATQTPLPVPLVNPLTGLEVADPNLLEIPAVLISISHFPATARPQAGLSFAPFVYEIYITEGATRFLTAFYGEWPAPEIPVAGGCQPRIGPLGKTATLLGNRVWYDADQDGRQDAGEAGIAGLCVNLFDAAGQLVAQTASDTNGHFGFDVQPGQYVVEFVRPAHLAFAPMDAAPDTVDSDADPGNGGAAVDLQSDDLSIDAGMIPAGESTPTTDPARVLPLAQVGPIRSGRLVYRHLAKSFQDSCLIFASASPEVLVHLPKCAVVFHQISGGGFMLDLSELWSVATGNQRRAGTELDYSAYHFTDTFPAEGRPATELRVYMAYQNQSGWYYDAPSQSYLRYVDTSELDQVGILHPETDRLTGRQLSVQNLIVMFANHRVISPTNLDIRLDPGRSGKAILFRDGQALDIEWHNPGEDQNGHGRPIQFRMTNGEPAPLRPGHTWAIVVTPETTVDQVTGGQWRLTFAQPYGSK